MRVTRWLQGLRIGGLALLVLFVAVGPGLAFAVGDSQPLEGRLYVRGTGLIEVDPDQAILSFGARGLESTAAAAMAEQAKQMQRANEILQRFGIPSRDIQTRQVVLREDWEYRQNERVLRGYVAEQGMHVAVDNLDALGALIDALVGEAGIPSISGIEFRRKDRQAAADTALRAAYAQAEARARALVEAAGGELLGPVQITDETADTAPMALQREMAFAVAADAAQSVVQPGILTVEARVRVEFAYRMRPTSPPQTVERVELDRNGVSLKTDRSAYAAGESITLRLINDGGLVVGYNLCSAQLQVQGERGWEPAPDSGRFCTMELRMLQSGESAEFAFSDLGSLEPGSYRFAVRVEMGGQSMETLTTEPFRIQ